MSHNKSRETEQGDLDAGDDISVLRQAVEDYPSDVSHWHELVGAEKRLERHENVLTIAREGIEYHPSDSQLWRLLAESYVKMKDWDAAAGAYEVVLLLTGQGSSQTGTTGVPTSLGGAPLDRRTHGRLANDFHGCGNAYFHQKLFRHAARAYQKAIELYPSRGRFINLGLTLSRPEISQDLDAADAYQRSFLLDGDPATSRKSFEVLDKRLKLRAERALEEAADLITKSEYFQFYLSPFEALDICDVADIDLLETRSIKRARKRLLSEIELSDDGCVPWLENTPLEPSTVRNLERELCDEKKRRHHWHVFQNKPLLRFLTRGEIGHFLYAEDIFPIETLELMEKEPSFRTFLSKPFEKQYRLLLKRALEQFRPGAIEVLQDGRRWVDLSCGDMFCEELEEYFRKHGSAFETRLIGCVNEWPKPIQELHDFLEKRRFAELLKLFPNRFHNERLELACQIRAIALKANNEHGDAKCAHELLLMCQDIRIDDEEIEQRIEEDLKAVTANVATPQTNPSQKPKAENTSGPANQFGCLFGAIAVVSILFVCAKSCDSTTSSQNSYTTGDNSRTGSSGAERSPARQWGNGSQPQSNTTTSGSQDVYRVPDYRSAELNRDSREVEQQRTTCNRLNLQMENLSQQIEIQRRNLDQTSQFAVDSFNRKVNEYNALVANVGTQQRLLNNLVDEYNAKLRRYGR